MNAQRTKHPVPSWGAICAVCCFAGGFGSALLGSVFTAGPWLWGATPHPILHRVGTALLILTIPLLILAGHCMDWMERELEKQRRELRGHNERQGHAA